MLDFFPMETKMEKKRQVFYRVRTPISERLQVLQLSIAFVLYRTFLPL